MIEGGAIDWAGHDNNTENNIDEIFELNRAIEAVCNQLEEMGELDDTLIIVTADHETGGLTLPGPYRSTLGAGESPATNWAVGSHTGTPVMVWAVGPGSLGCMGRIDNTDIFHVMRAALAE
jgi:alkaline phosphatase